MTDVELRKTILKVIKNHYEIELWSFSPLNNSHNGAVRPFV